MVTDLREIQENQWVSEIRIDKLRFVAHNFLNQAQYSI